MHCMYLIVYIRFSGRRGDKLVYQIRNIWSCRVKLYCLNLLQRRPKKAPCSSDPSAKPQSGRPSHTRLDARHFPFAHWNSPAGHWGTGRVGPQKSSSDRSAQSGFPSQRRARFRHGPLWGWGSTHLINFHLSWVETPVFKSWWIYIKQN